MVAKVCSSSSFHSIPSALPTQQQLHYDSYLEGRTLNSIDTAEWTSPHNWSKRWMHWPFDMEWIIAQKHSRKYSGPPPLQRGVNVARDIPRVLELSWEHMVNVVGNLFSETSDDDEHYCCSCTDLWNKVRELLPWLGIRNLSIRHLDVRESNHDFIPSISQKWMTRQSTIFLVSTQTLYHCLRYCRLTVRLTWSSSMPSGILLWTKRWSHAWRSTTVVLNKEGARCSPKCSITIASNPWR